MIALSQNFEDSSSSDLSELDSPSPPSDFSMKSPVQDASISDEEVLSPTYPMLTRHRHQVEITQRRSQRKIIRPPSYDESSSREDTPTAANCAVSRVKQGGKLTRRQSPRTIKRPRSYEESSSRVLTELESPLPETEYSSNKQNEPKPADLAPNFTTQDSPPPMRDTLITSHQIMNRSEYDVQPAKGHSTGRARGSSDKNEPRRKFRRRNRYRFPVKSQGNAAFPDLERFLLSHCTTSHGQTIQLPERQSSLEEQPILSPSFVQPSQDFISFPNDTLLSFGEFDFEQSSITRQNFNTLQMYATPSQQQFYNLGLGNTLQQQHFALQDGFYAGDQSLPDQQAPDLGHINPALIDPARLNPTILESAFLEANTPNSSFALPTYPVLLNVGKPNRIHILETKHFLPLCTFHEEPCDRALSDYEGDIDEIAPPKSMTGSRTEPKLVEKVKVTEYIYKAWDPEEGKRKLRARHKHRSFTEPRKPTRKPNQTYSSNKLSIPDPRLSTIREEIPIRVNKPVRQHMSVGENTLIQVPSPEKVHSIMKESSSTKSSSTIGEQTRFILLLRIYFCLNNDKIAKAFNKEFGDSLSSAGIRTRLEAVMLEPKFFEYRKILSKSKCGARGLQGLDDTLLAEANGFMQRLEE